MAYKILQKHWEEEPKPLVTFGKKGVVYLNVTVMKNCFNGVEWAEILYDDEKNNLAIKPLGKKTENAYHLKFTNEKSKSTAVIACRAVIKALGIDASQKKQYNAIWNSQKKYLEIKL